LNDEKAAMSSLVTDEQLLRLRTDNRFEKWRLVTLVDTGGGPADGAMFRMICR
jgi:hypothetical protein